LEQLFRRFSFLFICFKVWKTKLNTTMAESMDTTEVLPDEDDRKLFVGGLPQDAKQEDISAHFQTFGEIDNINIKTDPSTGRSRGFAFVVFKSVQSLQDAVTEQEHSVKGKKVAVKKAKAKEGKIYVGKLKPELSDEEIKSHFAQFGNISAVEQPFDKTKNERKNFCFITFEKEDHAKQLLKAGITIINGVELEVKKVTPKPDPRSMGMAFMGGRGGGRGGYNTPYNPYGDYYGYGYGDPYFAGGWGGYGGYGGGSWGGYDQYGGKGGAKGGAPRGGQGGGGLQAGGRGGGGQRGGGRGRGGGQGGGGGPRHEPY